MILDPEPRLRGDFELGHVESVEWSDRDGIRWEGRLYLPIGYSAAQKYPVVLQTHGISPPSQFSLLGKLDRTTAHAAQMLAGRGIAVLQVGDDQVMGRTGAALTPEEAPRAMRGYESAVQYLTHRGLADPNKIGLVGFSRSGWWVEYTLTHSNVAFAAAIASDHIDLSYVEGMLIDEGGKDSNFVQTLGAEPFGDGLARWLQSSPGFNADKVHTPLRLELAVGGLAWAFTEWEMYSRLKVLGKPVELFVVPDAEHAEHPLQIPSQQLASMQGEVDWMDFWLNGRESSDPAKRDQNARWRALREQQQAQSGLR
jgi:dipeptidyl aminopeptidase/acylaminoacyl peptidase